MGYRYRITLSIPAQVSCLSCVEHRQLLVGSGMVIFNILDRAPTVRRRWFYPPL